MRRTLESTSLSWLRETHEHSPKQRRVSERAEGYAFLVLRQSAANTNSTSTTPSLDRSESYPVTHASSPRFRKPFNSSQKEKSTWPPSSQTGIASNRLSKPSRTRAHQPQA